MAASIDNEKMATAIPWVNVFTKNETSGEMEQKTIRYDFFVGNLFKKDPSFPFMALHAAIGVCGEAGELGDAIKKFAVYGKPIDRENIIEELGDLRFYMQAAMNLWGITEYEVLQGNANKLGKRYVGLQYSDEAAQARADKVGE
jgi:NTP pyrophosphatase (non-canonical NTP hydrolase)